MERFLEGRSVIVTGASKGIGAACAVEAARRGAHVVVNWRSDEEGARETVEAAKDCGAEAVAVQADVSKPEEVDRLFDEALKLCGRLDALVANAGMQKDAPFLEMSVEDWRKVVDVNLTGQFLCAKRAAAIFRDQGRPESGRAAGAILFMSSVHDVIPWGGHVNYAAAKGGLDMLMRTVAQEVAPLGVRVLSVAPGAIRTEINREVWEDPEKARELLKLIPYGRCGEPEDIARPVAWLLSDGADYVTGATLYVDGGMTLYPGFIENG
jgi:glucose 1-dehydrogenase